MDLVKILLKIYMMLFAIVFLIVGVIVAFICRIKGYDDLGGTILIAVGIAAVISLVVFVILWFKQLYNKNSRNHVEMMTELRTHGITDKFMQLAAEGIELYDGTEGNFVYLKDCIIYGADGYIFRNEYDKALSYLNMMDIEKIKAGDLSWMDGGQSILLFFNVQMEYCERTKDKVRAENVMRDAKPYLDKYYGKSDMTTLLIDDIYFSYYYLNQDYMIAKEHAERMINNKYHVNKRMNTGYLCLALLYKKIGDDMRSAEYLEQARKTLTINNNALLNQLFEKARTELETKSIDEL